MTTFAAEMQARLSAIEARAKAAGTNMTQVCRRSGVARATVDRWLERVPQTVTKVDELEQAVAELEREAKPRAA